MKKRERRQLGLWMLFAGVLIVAVGLLVSYGTGTFGFGSATSLCGNGKLDSGERCDYKHGSCAYLPSARTAIFTVTDTDTGYCDDTVAVAGISKGSGFSCTCTPDCKACVNAKIISPEQVKILGSRMTKRTVG